MYSNKFVVVVFLAALVGSIESGLVPAVAPAPVAYHHAIPYNIPPYSDRVDIQSKVLSVPAIPAVHAVPAPAAVPAHLHAAIPAVHGIPAPAALSAHLSPAIPAVHGVPAPVALSAHLPAAVPAGYAAAPYAAYGLQHAAPLALPAAYPAPIAPAAYAYGHPALAAPYLKR